MSKKILAFGASNSKNSINRQLAAYAASLFQNTQVELLDLNDYEMPIYSIDREKESGIPEPAHRFYEKIGAADLILISFAEHNGAYSTAFKNIFDWTSRINNKTFQEKPLFLMSTSPGARGGSSVLEMAAKRFPYQGGEVKGLFSLPNFNDHFKDGKITNPNWDAELRKLVQTVTF